MGKRRKRRKKKGDKERLGIKKKRGRRERGEGLGEPATGYGLLEFSGDCTGVTCELTDIDGPKTVTANMAPITSTVVSSISGVDDVTLDVAGEGCRIEDAQFFAAAGSAHTHTHTHTYSPPAPPTPQQPPRLATSSCVPQCLCVCACSPSPLIYTHTHARTQAHSLSHFRKSLLILCKDEPRQTAIYVFFI